MLSLRTVLRTLALGAVVAATTVSPLAPAAHAAGPLDKINHLIVIYQENWSFDSLYGKFPGANGLAYSGDAVKQVDKNENPYETLPQPIDTRLPTPGPDERFPADLPVEPFDA